MSIEAMGWALTVPVGGNLKVILLGLANHAHFDGTEARPSIDRLAQYACCDRRTVQRNLRQLEADGWIRTVEPGGAGGAEARKATVYALAMGEGRQNATRDTGVAGGATPVSPQPSIEPSLERERAGAGAENMPKGVNADAWRRTLLILAEFNQRTGRRLQAVSGNGKPSESAKRIYQRVREHPELDSLSKWAGIIDRTLASRWWGDDAPSIGVVFGPKVFEDNIFRPPSLARHGRKRSAGEAAQDAMAAPVTPVDVHAVPGDEARAAWEKVRARAGEILGDDVAGVWLDPLHAHEGGDGHLTLAAEARHAGLLRSGRYWTGVERAAASEGVSVRLVTCEDVESV